MLIGLLSLTETHVLLTNATIIDRGRVKRLGESLNKLNKYCEALNSKKQKRSETMAIERSTGLNSMKIGSQIPRNSVDLVNQRIEERTKNAVLSRRIRSSVTEIRVCMQKI